MPRSTRLVKKRKFLGNQYKKVTLPLEEIESISSIPNVEQTEPRAKPTVEIDA